MPIVNLKIILIIVKKQKKTRERPTQGGGGGGHSFIADIHARSRVGRTHR